MYTRLQWLNLPLLTIHDLVLGASRLACIDCVLDIALVLCLPFGDLPRRRRLSCVVLGSSLDNGYCRIEQEGEKRADLHS